MKLSLFVLLAAGCTSFDPIERGVCGNGLIEPGEDCDSHDPSCVACQVSCTTAADCPTTAYACGVDGRCHAPGGGLAHPLTTGAFESSQFALTDVDHDGVGDAVGVSRSSIVVRFGEASGALSNEVSMVTPSQTGTAAFGKLDDDDSLDLTITTPDGIVAYTSPYGTISPLDIESFFGTANNAADIRMMYGITKLVVGGFVVDPSSSYVAYMVVDFINSNAPRIGAPCGIAATSAELSIDDVDVYQVSKDGDAVTDFVVSSLIGSGATKQLCVLAIHKDGLLSLPTVTDITPNAPKLGRKPILADLTADGDRCPSLVNTDGGVGGLRRWDGQMGIARCTFKLAAPGGDPLPDLPSPQTNPVVIGHAAFDPAIGTVAPDMLLVSDGLWAFTPGATPSFTSIYHANRRISHVATADLDHDGGVDIVLSGENQDDLDVLYRYGLLPAFQLYRIDTASAVTTITIDDFDGDSHADIAYTEQVAGHQRLMVAYGSADRPLDPIQVGAFADVISVVKLDFLDSVDVLGTDTDLALLLPGDPATLSFLHGSPQRTMLPYFDPRSDTASTGSLKSSTIFRGSAIGNFAPSVGAGPEHPDVVGIATPTGTGTANAQVHAWAAAGSGDGLDATTSDGVVVSGFADCTLGSTGLCVEDASYIAWPVAPGQDVALAIDTAQPPHAEVVDPWHLSGGAITPTAAPALVAMVPTHTTVRSMHAADVDGDGAADLIAAFAPDLGSMAHGAILVCAMGADGVPSACDDLVPVITAATPTVTACVDAAPGHLAYQDPFTTPAAAADVIVLCHGGGNTLHRVYRDAGGYHDEVLAHSTSALSQIQIGDVTGDGLDDVVALDGDAGSHSLVVFPQCSSRDLACLATASSATEAP